MGHTDTGRRVRAAAIVVAALGLTAGPAAALHPDALSRIATELVSTVVTLKVDLHEPDPRAASMQAPTLERRGWHHHNPTGPVALRAGERVEVTGVFNYSERGLFLELAGEAAGGSRAAITARPRIRIRIMVETPGTDPQAQQVEAIALIRKVIEPPPAP